MAVATLRPERRNYRRIYLRLWENPDFLKLADPLKLLVLYILTGPQTNRVGFYRFSTGLAAEHLNCELQQVKTRLATVCQVFKWEVDRATGVIWIPTWWDYNPVDNVKTFTGLLTDLNDVPRNSLAESFVACTQYLPEALSAQLESWLERLAVLDVAAKDAVRKVASKISESHARNSSGPKAGEGSPYHPIPVPIPSHKNVSVATSATPPPAMFLRFPTIGSAKTWDLSCDLTVEWEDRYPTLDVRGECRKALAWVEAYHRRRKTPEGMTRFLVNWFNRATNDRGGMVRSDVVARPSGFARSRDCLHSPRCPNPGDWQCQQKDELDRTKAELAVSPGKAVRSA